MFAQIEEKFGLLPTEVVQLEYVKNEMVDIVAVVMKDIAARKQLVTPEEMGGLLLEFFALYFHEIGMGVSAEIYRWPSQLPQGG